MKLLKSLWPVWFPHPTAWLEALIVGLLLTPLSIGWFFFTVIGATVTNASGNLGPFFLFSSVGFFVPFVVLAYIHSFFWKTRPPKWDNRLPSPRSIFEAFYALAATTVAGLISLSVVMFFINVRRYYTVQDYERFGSFFSIVWFVAAAYLYQIKRWLWMAMASENRTKISPPPDDSPFGDLNF